MQAHHGADPSKHASSPSPGHWPSWKPVTLRAPVLGGFVLISFLLIALLEVLSKRSLDKGGIIIARSADDLSPAQSFTYLHLPTIVAVLYSMLWSWVDLDTKRLEPYLQLSKPEGALAETSLLLQYPVEFLALIPFKAFRRRYA